MSILQKILSVFLKQQQNLQSEQQNNQQKIYFEVRGCDTFAHEYFSCGFFNTRSAAEKAVRQLEKSVKTQDESLRDEFWVVEMTDEKLAERQENEERILKEKHEELSYNSSHLADCVRELLQQFKSYWETADIKAIRKEGNKNLKQEVNWQHEDDCFEQVHFFTMYVKDLQILRIGVGVNIRNGKNYGGSIARMCQFSGTLEEMLEWAGTEKALDDCVKAIQKLILEFDD